MTAFTIVNLASNETIERAVYDDGRKAAKVAARLTAKTGRKYQVRKAAEGDANWREREAARFESGEYIPLIDTIRHSIMPDDFYGHIAKKNPELVAYTKDDAKGRADKQSLLSVRAFIDACIAHPQTRERIALRAHANGYTPDQVDGYISTYYGESWRNRTAKAQIDYATTLTCDLKFAGPLTSDDPTPEELKALMDQIADIYTNYDTRVDALGSSCMRMLADRYSSRDEFEMPIHPTAAYASPDLAIAYMQSADGKTLARALCWPEKKIYSRVYAGNDALHAALRRLGYEKSGYYGAPSSSKTFYGARLRRINHRGREDSVVLPYLDDDNKRVDTDGDDWLTMRGSEISAEITNGVAKVRGLFCCDNCDDSCDEDDMRTVYTNGRRTHSESWCESCCDHHAFWCNGYEEYFSDQQVESTSIGCDTYSLHYAEQNASWCDYYEEYTFDELTEVVVDTDGETRHWCENARSDHAFRWGGVWYSREHVDNTEVVVERYIEEVRRSWAHGTTGRLFGAYQPINVWYSDKVQRVPDHLIEDGEVEVYTGVDGRVYLRDYVDHYPVARERVAEDGEIVESWVTTAYAAHSVMVNVTLTHDRRAAEIEARYAKHRAEMDAAVANQEALRALTADWS